MLREILKLVYPEMELILMVGYVYEYTNVLMCALVERQCLLPTCCVDSCANGSDYTGAA
jgi:hypothetical protein